jgi:hypothetical protein
MFEIVYVEDVIDLSRFRQHSSRKIEPYVYLTQG